MGGEASRSVAVGSEELVVGGRHELIITVGAGQHMAVAHTAVVVGGVQRVLGVAAAAAAATAEAVALHLGAAPVVRLTAHPSAAVQVVLVAVAGGVVPKLGDLLVLREVEPTVLAVVLRVRVIVVGGTSPGPLATALRVAAQHGVAAALLAHHGALHLHRARVLGPQAHHAPQ